MAEAWTDVSAKPEFQALPPDQKESARTQYFDQVVAPQVPPEKLSEVRKQFDEQTGKIGFGSTGGGAATGNPLISQKSERSLRNPRTLERTLETIGGAGAVGAGMGAVAPEIMDVTAGALRMVPHPFAQTAAGGLNAAARASRIAGRGAGALAGGAAGVAGETAGQTVEQIGDYPVTAEVARVVAGGVGPELKNLAVWGVKKAAGAGNVLPTIMDALKKYAGKDVNLTAEQRKYIDAEVAALRGGEKTDAPLEKIGSIMGDEGQRIMSAADQQMMQANLQAAGVGRAGNGQPRELADIGGQLRDTIAKKQDAAFTARSSQYKANEQARDSLISQAEKSNRFPSQLPEYESLVNELKAQLNNTDAMNRSPTVQANFAKILSEITNPKKDVFGQPQPVSFQALDDVRRKLGDAFRGKPAEGYESIGENTAKDLYHKVSDIQKKYAGGENGPQAALLDDYAQRTEGLQQFSTKYGKKATALDNYQPDTYKTDASTLPTNFFKTRESIRALKELTGNESLVHGAALEYADKQLAGKNADQAREWVGKNAEWLRETGITQSMVLKYVDRLEGSERAMRNAQDFATQAAKDNKLLTRGLLPPQRAVDLIKSGDTELWAKVVPAIVQSPQAKQEMLNATRQVIADQATASGTINLFNRNIRPFLEQSKIATTQELDDIALRLKNIQAKNVPETEKLGIARRMLLQAVGGYASGGASRSVNWITNFNSQTGQ